MIYHASELITDQFDSSDIHYRVSHGGTGSRQQEEVEAGFYVDCGPNVTVKFISRDDDNDVAIRMFGIIRKIPEENRPRMLEACNILNGKIRYYKFYVDEDGDLNMEYDFPMRTDDCCLGEMAEEMFVRSMHILDENYQLFMKALYTNEKLADASDGMHSRFSRMLEELLADREEDDDNEDMEDDDQSPDEDASAPSVTADTERLSQLLEALRARFAEHSSESDEEAAEADEDDEDNIA